MPIRQSSLFNIEAAASKLGGQLPRNKVEHPSDYQAYADELYERFCTVYNPLAIRPGRERTEDK
jgi:hypothetical protein